LAGAAAACGASLEQVAAGVMIASVVGSRPAVDLATRAARCALALRARVPEIRAAIATDYAQVRSDRAGGPVVVRALELLRQDCASSGPLLDATLARLCARGYLIETSSGVSTLGRAREPFDVPRELPFEGRD